MTTKYDYAWSELKSSIEHCTGAGYLTPHQATEAEDIITGFLDDFADEEADAQNEE